MANPWKDRVLAFNRQRKEEGAKARDMDMVIAKMQAMPPGQLKKWLDDEEFCAMLRKYGVDV